MSIIEQMNDYQHEALKTATFNPATGKALVYNAMGLAGEAGELVGAVSKLMRDRNFDTNLPIAGQLEDNEYDHLAHELGDVMWFVASLSESLDLDLATIATMNIDKLRDRQSRGVIAGSGDNR